MPHSSRDLRSSTAVSRLQRLLGLLIAASLLSASVISFQASHTPRLKRAAPASRTHGNAAAQVFILQRVQTGATEEDEDNELASVVVGTVGDNRSRGGSSPEPEDASATAIAALQQETPPDEDKHSGIPHIIHQSWKSRSAIPQRFEPWMRSWTSTHPTWTYVFWTDADNLALFETLYPQYLHVAQRVDKIGLADMARYALLHRVGGLYVDADFECVRPFDELLRDHELFVSSEPRAHTVLLENSESVSLCNALMASKPKHPFWLRVLDAIQAKFEREGDSDPVGLTGPRMLNQTYFAHFAPNTGSTTAALPSEFFYPEIAYWNAAALERACRVRVDAAAMDACAWLKQFPRGEFTESTHATHHWQCTWCQGDGSRAYVSLQSVFADAPRVVHTPQISLAAGIEFVPLAF